MEQVSDSDFGIFVFSPDDMTESRDKLFLTPRDNVVYELGLFSGKLGPNRCFFVTPSEIAVHVPSDLLGTQPGTYESDRGDKNWVAAVSPFCTNVRQMIGTHGLRRPIDQGLLELIVKYECCDWIGAEGSSDPKVAKQLEDKRVNERRTVFSDMVEFCRKNPVANKRRLLQKKRVGFYLALAAATMANQAEDDDKLITTIDGNDLPKGFARSMLVHTLANLAEKGKIKSEREKQVVEWAERLTTRSPSKVEPTLAAKLRSAASRLS